MISGASRSGRASIRGVELAYELAGPTRGTPLVWGHGLTSSRADEDGGTLIDWPAVTARARVLRYDARGHGESGLTAEPRAYGWDALALDQLELAGEAGVEAYVAGGASLGAATALHAAVAAPDRVVGLVLAIPPTGWETRAEQTDIYERMARVVERAGVEPLIAAASALPTPDPFVGRPEWDERRARAMRAADPDRLAAVFRGAATANLPPREVVALVEAPTLILAWSGDAGHPVSSAEALVELMPHAELSVARSWDDLGRWTDRLLGFLAAF